MPGSPRRRNLEPPARLRIHRRKSVAKGASQLLPLLLSFRPAWRFHSVLRRYQSAPAQCWQRVLDSRAKCCRPAWLRRKQLKGMPSSSAVRTDSSTPLRRAPVVSPRAAMRRLRTPRADIAAPVPLTQIFAWGELVPQPIDVAPRGPNRSFRGLRSCGRDSVPPRAQPPHTSPRADAPGCKIWLIRSIKSP